MSRLRAALDALAAGGADLPQRVAAFQAQLLNSEAHLLVSVDSRDAVTPAGLDPATQALAVRAARDGLAMEGRAVASTVAQTEAVVHVALHRLSQDTPLAQALARERLELVRALVRAHAGQQTAEVDALLLRFAASEWTPAALHAFAADFARHADAPRLAFAMLLAKRVVQVADSASAILSPDARRGLELAAGEIADSGAAFAEAGTGGFTGFDRLAEGTALRAVASLSPQGDGIVTMVWPGGDVARALSLSVRAAPIAVARLTRPSLSDRFDRLAARAPWPAAVPIESRPRRARQILLGALLAVLLVPLPDRVRAPLSIEPKVRRVVTAPLTARIDAVLAEPGDRVAAGALLLRFDAAQLAREQQEAEASLQAAATQAATARADGDVESERLAQLKAAQLAAQVAMLQDRLAEADVRAPIAGTVQGEDLRRRVGATVSRGEPLYSIAGAGGYRAELLVGDSDVSRLVLGARVTMRLSAAPLSVRRGSITRIYPLAEVVDGRNIFRTLVAIDAGDTEDLRAGMSGSGAITAGWAPLAWQAVRPAIRWVRLKLWI